MADGANPSSSDEQFTRNRFKDKVAIVTGGASGIGKATVERFASDGAAVAIFDINEEAGKDVQGALQSAGHQVKFYSVDVSDRDKCLQAVEQVASEHGGLVHLLVNGVAIFLDPKEPWSRADPRDVHWKNGLSINVQSFANMVQACHPYMIKAGPGQCAVVNIASIAAHTSLRGAGWVYGASKGAVISLTRCMALDLAKNGIRVNSVSPGWIFTPTVASFRAEGNREKFDKLVGCYSMFDRSGDPSEVAAAITYLCSRDASFITATDLRVDGGTLSLSREGYRDTST